MLKYLTVFLVVVFLSACSAVPPPPPVTLAAPPAIIEVVEVTADASLGFSQALGGWVVSPDVPEYLLEEFVHHIEHELEDKGINRTHEEMRAIARKRLASNELYIYREASRAWIAVDFSPLYAGERSPDRQAVFNSARYAADSLMGEEGVSEVRHSVQSVALQSAEHAFRLDADFQSHGEERKFAGVIGFANPYWVFVYYTDELADADDYLLIDRLLNSMTVIKK